MQENSIPNNVKMPHSLQIDRRRRACVTGVSDVCSYHENEIVLRLESGLMILTGQNLHIGRLLLEEGKLDVDGMIDGINYENPSKRLGFFGSLFHREK